MKNSVKILLCIFLFLVLVSGVQAAETYQFVTAWGTYGSGDGQFLYPIGVAVDTSGNVYVAEYVNNRIQKFSSTGTFLGKWGSNGTGDGQFNCPNGIAFDSSGNIYVADMENNRIQKFSSSGTFLLKWGSEGWNAGQLYKPFGVAVDSSGNVYVADHFNGRIQKFSSTGTFLTMWGSHGSADGQFIYPSGVVVDSSGNIYVLDTQNHRVQKFTSNGAFITKWGSFGSGDGQFSNPQGLAIDSLGNIYVGDTENGRFQKFTSNGTFLTKGGTGGSGEGQFRSPVGIAVDSAGNVYIVDYGNYRIQKFATAQSLLAVSGITPSTAMNTSAVSITELSGAGFVSGATVKLTKTGSPDIISSGVTVASPTKITCSFDLTGKGAGQWNVVVTNPDGTSAILPEGFSIYAPVHPLTYNLTGSWDMGGPDGVWGFGKCMALSQSGSLVTGNYIHEQGRVTGTVTGNTFFGTWSEAPTYTGEMDSGKFVVTISSDGNSFSGTVGYGNSSTGYSWTGTKSSEVCPVTQPPTLTPLSVTTISPAFGTNDQSISATVTGTGFKPESVVRLTLTGQPDIIASGVTLSGDSLVTCTLDLTGKTTGTWDLAVTNPGDGTTSVRSTAFTITTRHITNTNGTIIVSSTQQDALVYLDGSFKGTGSVTLVDVSPGDHSVRVTKTMYNDYVTDIRVVTGSVSYVNAVLTPISGTIIASTNPAGANVYLDGMDKGISPVTITGVSSGLYTVSFTKTGYTDASRTVTMTAGQTMEISVDLTKTGGGRYDWLNTTTLILVGIIVLIIVIIVVLLRKKKNRWDNY